MEKDIVLLVAGNGSHSGKGTFSERLESNLKGLGLNVIRCSLSTYIRRITEQDFFCEDMESINARKFMAEVYRLGTELIYPYHKGRRMWERDVVPRLNNDSSNIIIVESFRELNDFDYFTKLLNQKTISKIVTIQVVRPNFNILDEELTNHRSERDLDGYVFDYIITNDGSLEDLFETIKDFTNMFIFTIDIEDYKSKDIFLGSKVKVIKLHNIEKSKHLLNYINKEGHIFSWIIKDGIKRYKVLFDDANGETAYFRYGELQQIN